MNLKSFVIQLLRRGSVKWAPRNNVMNAAKVENGTFSTGKKKFLWKCNICGKLFKRKDVVADHINPVVNTDGENWSWDDYIKSLFCDESNYQCICETCHNEKTQKENAQRTKNKRNKKNEKHRKNGNS